MGTGIDLGNNDSIENYREEEMPENYDNPQVQVI